MSEPTSVDARCLLFVYGSLKRGQPNHRQLSGARFVAVVRTVPAFALRALAGYPALVPGARAISGELYEVSLHGLLELDEFEGADYVRQTVELAGNLVAMAYVARESEAGEPLPVDEWPAPERPNGLK